MLELTDLVSKQDGPVDSLSRGMQQRLGLARVLIHDPKVLILDEPASGLDPRARIEMRELLRELKRMGKTIMISSHILSELEEICDRDRHHRARPARLQRDDGGDPAAAGHPEQGPREGARRRGAGRWSCCRPCRRFRASK